MGTRACRLGTHVEAFWHARARATGCLSQWFCAAACVLYLSAVPCAPAQSKLPDGPGKALVERTCKKCHAIENITRVRLTPERWGEVIDDMISRGAEGTDEEFDQMVEYLAKNFGRGKASATGAKTPASQKINVNKATAKELATALDLSAEDAEAIVRYREKNGDFKEWQDLKKVPGIDTKKIEDNKDRIEM